MTPPPPPRPKIIALGPFSTSMRWIASAGIMFMSTAAAPRPTVPLMLSSAEVCARVPLMSTSVWSGDRPRSVAGRTTSVPSVIDGWGKLNDGTSWFSRRLVSV